MPPPVHEHSQQIVNAPPDSQIIICNNSLVDSQSFQHTVVHELVHAYDQCRAKIEFKNCLHIACTEVLLSFCTTMMTMNSATGCLDFILRFELQHSVANVLGVTSFSEVMQGSPTAIPTVSKGDFCTEVGLAQF